MEVLTEDQLLIGGFVAGVLFMSVVALIAAAVARYRFDKAVESILNGDEREHNTSDE